MLSRGRGAMAFSINLSLVQFTADFGQFRPIPAMISADFDVIFIIIRLEIDMKLCIILSKYIESRQKT